MLDFDSQWMDSGQGRQDLKFARTNQNKFKGLFYHSRVWYCIRYKASDRASQGLSDANQGWEGLFLVFGG